MFTFTVCVAVFQEALFTVHGGEALGVVIIGMLPHESIGQLKEKAARCFGKSPHVLRLYTGKDTLLEESLPISGNASHVVLPLLTFKALALGAPDAFVLRHWVKCCEQNPLKSIGSEGDDTCVRCPFRSVPMLTRPADLTRLGNTRRNPVPHKSGWYVMHYYVRKINIG